jgi:YHS domain-containing protein
VTLVEKRQWRPGDKNFGVVHRGRTYLFVDAAAQTKFLSDPDRYSPVLNGNDVVMAIGKNEIVPGRREHGVFYQDHIYLFSSEESAQAFDEAPEKYAAAATRITIRQPRPALGSAAEKP